VHARVQKQAGELRRSRARPACIARCMRVRRAARGAAGRRRKRGGRPTQQAHRGLGGLTRIPRSGARSGARELVQQAWPCPSCAPAPQTHACTPAPACRAPGRLAKHAAGIPEAHSVVWGGCDQFNARQRCEDVEQAAAHCSNPPATPHKPNGAGQQSAGQRRAGRAPNSAQRQPTARGTWWGPCHTCSSCVAAATQVSQPKHAARAAAGGNGNGKRPSRESSRAPRAETTPGGAT